jgi:hypothetical protein
MLAPMLKIAAQFPLIVLFTSTQTTIGKHAELMAIAEKTTIQVSPVHWAGPAQLVLPAMLL